MEEAIEPSVQETESTGLLDGASPEVEEANTDQVEIDHRDPDELKAKEEFAVKNGDEESSEIPDYYPENFIKDGVKDEEALVKSYNHFKKLVSQGKHKAPEDGKYDASAFGNTPEDDPIRSHVMDWAKEYNVSQAALDSLVGQVVDMNQQSAESYEVNLAEERKALGPNADARINSMVSWGKNFVQKGIWSNEDFDEFKIMGGTAKGLAALEKLRASQEGRVPLEATPVEGAPSKVELQAMVADPRYQDDPSYRQKVERAFQQVYG